MQSEDERRAWVALNEFAERQHGLVTRSQIDTVLTRRQFATRAERGLLAPAARGVWRMVGAPPTWRQRVMAACLAVGPPVAATGVTAARLWRLDGVAPSPAVHLVVPVGRSGKDVAGATVHRAPLAAEDVEVCWGVPTATVARTLGDLAAELPFHVVARAADDALRRALVTTEELVRIRDGRRRHPGLTTLHRVVEARATSAPGDSLWEDRVFGWLVGAGLAPPARAYVVELPSGIAVLDMAYPDRRLGVEFDGWEWHRVRRRFDHDRVRASELAIAGWRMVVVTSTQPEAAVVDRVRRALAC